MISELAVRCSNGFMPYILVGCLQFEQLSNFSHGCCQKIHYKLLSACFNMDGVSLFLCIFFPCFPINSRIASKRAFLFIVNISEKEGCLVWINFSRIVNEQNRSGVSCLHSMWAPVLWPVDWATQCELCWVIHFWLCKKDQLNHKECINTMYKIITNVQCPAEVNLIFVKR